MELRLSKLMFQRNEIMQIKNTEQDSAVFELLEIVIEFTRRRDMLLRSNVADMNKPCFAPQEFPVDDFVNQVEKAIAEQICEERILLEDSEYVKFSANGGFEVYPAVDEAASVLFKKDIVSYLRLQEEKVAENQWLLTQARSLLSGMQTAEMPLAV